MLRPSIQQSDGRSAAEVAELAAEVDEAAFLKRTGNGINQQLIAAKSRWLERHEPADFAKIATVFGSYDFINLRSRAFAASSRTGRSKPASSTLPTTRSPTTSSR